MIFFAKRGTSVKSHATHAARARNKRGSSVDFARILRGFCVGFARNLILFLFEREHEGYKRFADCTVDCIEFHAIATESMSTDLANTLLDINTF